MPAVNCPYCGNDNEVAFLADGATVRCYNCGNGFVPRGYVQTVDDYQPPQVIVVNHTPATRYQPRLRAEGWFTRSFATTAGCLTAFLVFNVIGVIVVLFAFAVLITFNKQAAPTQPAKVSRMR